jgi:hypothetical protein
MPASKPIPPNEINPEGETVFHLLCRAQFNAGSVCWDTILDSLCKDLPIVHDKSANDLQQATPKRLKQKHDQRKQTGYTK